MCIYLYYDLFLLFSFLFLKKQDRKIFIVGAIFLFLLIAFRTFNVGGDTLNYSYFYENKNSIYGMLKSPGDDIEIAFVYFARLCKQISPHYLFFQIAITTVSLIPLFILIYRHSNNRTASLLLFMTVNSTYAIFMGAARQTLAMGIIYMAILLYEKRQNKYYYILSIIFFLLSLLTHSTSYISIFILLTCKYITMSKKNYILILVGSVIISVFISQINLLSYFTSLNLPISYKIDNYVKWDLNERFSLGSVLPLTILAMLIILTAKKEELKNIYLKSFVIGVIIFNIFSFFPLAFRMTTLLISLGFIYMPTQIKARRNFYYLLLVLIVLVFQSYRHYEHTLSDKIYRESGERILPYSSVIFK